MCVVKHHPRSSEHAGEGDWSYYIVIEFSDRLLQMLAAGQKVCNFFVKRNII